MPNLEEIRSEIVRLCEHGYTLADEICGMSLIWHDDVAEPSPGVFLLSFRLPVEKKMALSSFKELLDGRFCVNSDMIEKECAEYGIPFLECRIVFSPEEEGKGMATPQ